MAFCGFPYVGVDFFRELHTYNNHEWWNAHRDIYLESVRTPFELLLAQIGPQFGKTAIFPPKSRGAADGSTPPYKEHQGAVATSPHHHTWYVHLDAQGLMAGGGIYHTSPDQVVRMHRAIRDDVSGFELEMILSTCQKQGFRIDGRVIDPNQSLSFATPRSDLLNYSTLQVHFRFGTPAWMYTAAAAERVRQVWEATRPLIDWLDRYVGIPTMHRVVDGQMPDREGKAEPDSANPSRPCPSDHVDSSAVMNDSGDNLHSAEASGTTPRVPNGYPILPATDHICGTGLGGDDATVGPEFDPKASLRLLADDDQNTNWVF